MSLLFCVFAITILTFSYGQVQDREEAARLAAVRKVLNGNNAATIAINMAATQAATAIKAIDAANVQARNAALQAGKAVKAIDSATVQAAGAVAEVNRAAAQAANAVARANDALVVGVIAN